ncbi:MAG: hypothetical protein IE909_19515, partial [Campylobacterales bacterium]|nr:hypothetical protein [Campylobacterales bacterium]
MYCLKYEEPHRSEWTINLKVDVKIKLEVDVQVQVLWLADENPKEAKQGG